MPKVSSLKTLHEERNDWTTSSDLGPEISHAEGTYETHGRTQQGRYLLCGRVRRDSTGAKRRQAELATGRGDN